jgi:Leucine-rich repeat (LRR) protein
VSAQPRYVTLKEASKMHSDSVTAIRLVEGDNAVELLSYGRLNSLLCDGINSFPYPFPSVAITALHLRDFSTTFLPKCIYQLSELTELIIEDQVLNTIPYEFKALDGLQHLTLITPNLTYIDKEALFLKDLVFLHFDSRKIKLASEHIQMPKLEKLYLYGEVLSFPKFGTFPDLNVLHLHNGTSTAIDPSVFDLPKLEEFHTCDPIIHLNEGISRLNQLTTLSLCSHQNHPTWSNPCASETYFPQVNLSTTNGTFPRLESLPNAICSLQKLSTLDLHGSGIQSLPECLWGIDSLRSIYVTDTKLAKLPGLFFASERDLGLIKITISQPNHFDKSSKKALKKIPTIERIKRKKGTFKRTFLVTKVFGKP